MITKLLLLLLFLLPFSNALLLSDFPKPFVSRQGPVENLAIVVGDDADGSDVIGAVDIIQSLQGRVMVSEAGVPAEADFVEIGSTSDLLTFNEQIGNVRDALTEIDLDMLKGGQITTDQGSTEYNQYLRFFDDNRTSGSVRMTKDERDRVGDFLYFNASLTAFQWELEFEEGLESEVKGNDLVDLEDEDITILGMPFVIVDTDVFNRSAVNTSGGSPDVKIEFMAGAVSATLGENDKETYVVDDKEYEVEVLIISETANKGDGAAKLRINGEITDSLSDGDTDVLSDGTMIGIRDVVSSGKDIQKSIVQFYIGAFKIEFRDSNSSDTLGIVGAEVNEETIEDATVVIRGQFIADPAVTAGTQVSLDGARFEIQSVKYNLSGDAVLGDVFIPVGAGLRAQLDEPEGMLTPYWDIVYEGLTNTGETIIELRPVGRKKYRIELTNQESLFYDFPVFNTDSDNGVNGTLKFGDDDHNFWFTEFLNATVANGSSAVNDTGGAFTTALQNGAFLFYISERDYFAVSRCHSGDNNDNTCFTHILQYDDIDTDNRQLTFEDLSTGTTSVTYDSSTFIANLVVAGETYKVGVQNDGASALSPYRLMIDLNGDGIRNNCTTVRLGVPGGGLISFGEELHPLITNYVSVGSPNATSFCGLNANGSLIEVGTTTNSTSFSVITLPRALDDGGSSVSGGGNISPSEPGEVTIPVTGFDPALNEGEDVAYAVTAMGDVYELQTPAGNSSTLMVRYPLKQRGVRVVVKGPSKLDESETVVFEIGLAKLASEIDDIAKYNSIVVGGPCANQVAAVLLGNPAACHETVPENKAIVRLFNHGNGNVALLINGRTAEKTREASRAVASGVIAKENSDMLVI